MGPIMALLLSSDLYFINHVTTVFRALATHAEYTEYSDEVNPDKVIILDWFPLLSPYWVISNYEELMRKKKEIKMRILQNELKLINTKRRKKCLVSSKFNTPWRSCFCWLNLHLTEVVCWCPLGCCIWPFLMPHFIPSKVFGNCMSFLVTWK